MGEVQEVLCGMFWLLGLYPVLFGWDMPACRSEDMGKGAQIGMACAMVCMVVLFMLIEWDRQRRLPGESVSSRSHSSIAQPVLPNSPEIPPLTFYKVQRGDSLPKISRKFYGTSRLWRKILQANREILSSPRHLRVGMVLFIPPQKPQMR